MSEEVRLWRITDRDTLDEVGRAKLDLEARLESWIEEDISVLSSDLMVIGRQVGTAFGGSIDLLCIDSQGDLTIVELKRDLTPREVVAQALDYASWVASLSHEEVSDLAESYLNKRGREPFEEAFRSSLNAELPETLNQDHQVIVVGSDIDDSSERIVRYLSERGVGVNVATFSYFRDASGEEFLARTFLIEPEEVDRKRSSAAGSKRRPPRSYEEFEKAAQEHGVGHLYDRLLDGVWNRLNRKKTLSSVGGGQKLDRGWRSMVNVLPEESDQELGLGFQIYTKPLADYLGLSVDQVVERLPEAHSEWSYGDTPDLDYHGYAGYFQSTQEVDEFLILFGGAPPSAQSSAVGSSEDQ